MLAIDKIVGLAGDVIRRQRHAVPAVWPQLAVERAAADPIAGANEELRPLKIVQRNQRPWLVVGANRVVQVHDNRILVEQPVGTAVGLAAVVDVQPAELRLGVAVGEAQPHRVLTVERLDLELAGLTKTGLALLIIPFQILPDLRRQAIVEIPLPRDLRLGQARCCNQNSENTGGNSA